MTTQAPLKAGHLSCTLFINDFPGRSSSSTLGWYFSGPDRRYNGASAFLNLTEADDFVVAAREALTAYEALAAKAPAGVDVTREVRYGKYPFKITTNRLWRGVHLFPQTSYSFECAIKNRHELASLEELVSKARELEGQLASI